jgi:hypothetical protein
MAEIVPFPAERRDVRAPMTREEAALRIAHTPRLSETADELETLMPGSSEVLVRLMQRAAAEGYGAL